MSRLEQYSTITATVFILPFICGYSLNTMTSIGIIVIYLSLLSKELIEMKINKEQENVIKEIEKLKNEIITLKNAAGIFQAMRRGNNT